LKQFFNSDLSRFNTSQQTGIFEEIENILHLDLWDGEQWIADYRRIKVIASKQTIIKVRFVIWDW